jgi:serine/threonine-protein kinase
MSLAAGTRLGPYEVLSPLAAGGMGEVYRARDPRLGRDVAIKVLPAAFSADADRLLRFEQEARAAAALNHPNILAVYDIGTHDGSPYIVSELLDGETLRAALDSGPLPWPRTTEIALQLLAGLDAAHSRGIVHRDLKPDNLFLTRAGVVKILDFGLAKVVTEGPAHAGEPDVTRAAATLPGLLIGTVGYMAPEQVRCEPPDPRSDLFAVGAMLYEMLTGERPFRGSSPVETLSAVLREHPPDLTLDASREVPRPLARITHRCLTKDANDRFQSARDLRFAIEVVAERSSATATPRIQPRDKSIAVLPFANMNADPEHQYFSDGLSEELINALARLPGLRVAARTSAFRFRGRDVDIREIGRQLNVATVLEGSVRRAGTRLRITAQLLNAADGYHLWSDRYDRELEDVFAIQDDLTASIVRTLEPTLLGRHESVAERHSSNVAAFEQYLRGQHLWYQRTPQSVRAGVASFEAAIRLDPNYALAHAGLARFYSVIAFYGFDPLCEGQARAEAAATRAIALGPALAESQFAMAEYTMLFNEAWETAEPYFKNAIELPQAAAYYSMFLAMRRRFDEVQARVREATALDPLSPWVHSVAARAMYDAGQYEDAIRLGERALELHPDFALALWILGLAQSRLGRHDRAIALLEKAVSVSARAPFFVGLLGLGLAAAGRIHDARALLDELRTRSAHEYVIPVALLAIQVGLGHRDDIYAALVACVDQKYFGFIIGLIFGHYLDDLASEPRFAEVFCRLHLAARATKP